MKIPIKYQFSFFVALLLCSAIVLISISMFRHEKQSLITERQLRGKTLVRNLATASAEAILSGNELNLFSYCNDIIEHEDDAEYVIILDAQGTIIAHNKPEFVGKKCDDALCDAILQSDTLMITPAVYQNKQLYDYSMPMVILEKRIGSVRVLMSNASILRKMAQLEKEILQLSCLAIVLGLVLTILLVHVLVKPIAKLSEGAFIIGKGNFLHRITVRSRNEIGELAKAFNAMGASLQTRKDQLASLNETARALNTTLERDTLCEKSLQAINDIISPQQCLLCLFRETDLLITKTSGFEHTGNGMQEKLSFPDDVYNELFALQKAHLYPAATLRQTLLDSALPVSESCKEILMVPLVYEDKKQGVFILLDKKNNDVFSESDREFAEILSASTTISLLNIALLEETAEKARMEAELKTAETVQKTLFPKKTVTMDGIEVAGYFQSASETGGDWYGYIEDPQNKKLSIFIGDVTGHGVPAALITAAANSFIRTIGILQKRYEKLAATMPALDKETFPVLTQPTYLLSLLNHIILKSTDRQLAMTFFASTFDLERKKVFYANAGHEMPVIIRSDQDNHPASLSASGTRLGDKEDASFEQHTTDLHTGDVVILYTDGITECLNRTGEEFGVRRFLRKIKKAGSLSASAIVNTLIDDVHTFRDNEPLHDDITLVAAKIL